MSNVWMRILQWNRNCRELMGWDGGVAVEPYHALGAVPKCTFNHRDGCIVSNCPTGLWFRVQNANTAPSRHDTYAQANCPAKKMKATLSSQNNRITPDNRKMTSYHAFIAAARDSIGWQKIRPLIHLNAECIPRSGHCILASPNNGRITICHFTSHITNCYDSLRVR